MELWIRSQDKKHLLKVDNIKWFGGELYTNSRVHLETIKDGVSYSLGIYHNGKRALEVLDEIQKGINEGCFKGEERYVEKASCYVIPKLNVYEMPKE